jgi:FkbM family methyltransferase
MLKLRFNDVGYAICHPIQALRYLCHRDRIGYDICARCLPANPVIVEAGAYDGSNTQEFCRLWPDCTVYAFEPVPSAYERLLTVAAELPDQIHPQQIALGCRTETSEMYVSLIGPCGGEQSSSLLAPSTTRQEFPFVDFQKETIRVQVTRLDVWAAEKKVTRVDFLWLDLQGVELAALEGCGDLLATVSAIHCEVQNVPLYEGAPLYPEVSRWLKKHGFRIAREAVFRRGGNVLFVRGT